MLGWTERHRAVAIAVAVGFLVTLTALPHPVALGSVVVAAAAVAVIGGLSTDGFGGIVLGLVAAAGSIGIKRLTGAWDSDLFWPSIVEAVALVAAGGAAGKAGSVLRGRATQRPEAVEAPALAPVYGSLGLLSEGVGLARLEEEIERSRAHRRPLSVVVFHTTVIDPDLDPEARESALRALARLVESQTRTIDVPFALSAETLAVILPEVGWGKAWDTVAPILDAASRAHFVVRREDRTRALCGAVVVDLGIATRTATGQSMSGRWLLDEAMHEALRPATERQAA